MSDYASSSSRPATPVGDLPSIGTARPFRFHWDASYRKPGPGSVSETTEGRGGNDYFVGNAVHYDLYNTSATSLNPTSLPAEWSSSVHGFHAISTVVNNPHKRSAPPKAHSSLPAVPPSDLPRVRRKDFDAYLRSVAPEWERFKQNVELGREGVPQISDTSSSSHLNAGIPDEGPVTPRTPKAPLDKPLPPLQSVPEVFFDQRFNLADPKTFNIVLDHDELDPSDPLAPEQTQPVLDRLSGYADTVEQHLVREISVRSTSFFAALSNLQDLQSESEQCLDRISHLRALLKEVDEKGAKKGLEIVRMENKLRNVEAVKESVKYVGGVMEMTGVAKSLVNAGQWGEALDVIDELNALWDTDSPQENVPPPTIRKDSRQSNLATVEESPPQSPELSPLHKKALPTVPISSLQAFASLPSHLRDLTLEITSSLTSEVVHVLRQDLIERVDADKGKSVEARQDGLRLSLKDRLRPLLLSLARTEGIREATNSWKDVVVSEIRNTLQRRIPQLDFEDDDAAREAESAKQLRELPQPGFMELARTMYTSFLNYIEGIQAQNTIIIEVLEAIRHPKSSIESVIASMREDLADILSSAGELANGRAAKVVGVRNEQHTALELMEFYTFFNTSWDFVVRSEVVCKRMIVALRGVLVSQAKSFLQAFHQARISQSAKLVEDEQWNPAEVAPSVQQQIDILVDASIRDPIELLFDPPPPTSASYPLSQPNSPSPPITSPGLTANGPIRPSSPLPSPNLNRQSTNGSGTLSPPRRTSGPGKHLKIEDRNYFAVGATLEVLILLVDYLKVVMNLPMLTTDTMSRVIELLKAFNSRTCQVVLGAGAMRSAGLKNITAKHLALASQSLSIMISLIPYVRETFRRHLNQKQAAILIEFDKLKRDYQEHQNEIHAKLIAIMGDRLSAHIRTLQAVRWDQPPQREGANEYMELLVKETVTLHKVLSRYLSPSVVEYVMSQVFAAINHRLSEEYTKIELPSQEAKERLLADARYLIQKLSGLKNVGAPTAMLETVVTEKTISRKNPPQSPAPQPTTPNTASRLKGILGRHVQPQPQLAQVVQDMKRAPTPTTPSVPSPAPDVEKALPMLSPTPPVLSSVTPSPPPPETKSPPVPDHPGTDVNITTPSREQAPAPTPATAVHVTSAGPDLGTNSASASAPEGDNVNGLNGHAEGSADPANNIVNVNGTSNDDSAEAKIKSPPPVNGIQDPEKTPQITQEEGFTNVDVGTSPKNNGGIVDGRNAPLPPPTPPKPEFDRSGSVAEPLPPLPEKDSEYADTTRETNGDVSQEPGSS